MFAKVLAFPMAATEPQPIPSYQPDERTGIHKCVRCTEEVDAETYLALDHVCAPCDAKDAYPYAGGQQSGFRPYDRAEVRAEIGRRDRVRA